VTIFDVIRYPISHPATDEELQALPPGFIQRFVTEAGGIGALDHLPDIEITRRIRAALAEMDNDKTVAN